MALMLGLSAGAQMVAPQNASAEISDKFRMEINGVIGYNWDSHQLGYGKYDSSAKKTVNRDFWNNYTRLQLNYYQDKNTMFQARLHSGYETIIKDEGNLSTNSDAYFDQAFLQLRDRKANMVYILGKKGAFLGQGLIHNSTGNLTGAQVSFGNWYDPTCLQLLAGQKKDGSNFFAANFTHNITKPWQFSLTYIDHDKDVNKTGDGYYSYYDHNGNKKLKNYNELHLLSIGSKVKAKTFTVQGEFIHNYSDKVQNGAYSSSMKKKLISTQNSARRAWFIEVFTGPTSDMTSGLPLQKPGTNVWSLKYQDVGANATDAHNTTFFDDARGWRLNYGHTFKKGLSADIAVMRMQDKGQSDYDDNHNGKWKNAVIAEIAYKFR